MALGLEGIAQTYQRRTPRSRELHERAALVLPGGDTRTVTSFAPYPTYMVAGEGTTLVDADGNEYVDFLNNYTSLIHGHGHPYVSLAIQQQLQRGMSFAAPHELQIELAERIAERVKSVEQVRFCNSGTEAVMTALQAARALTGRQLIAKMEGGYHGSYDHVRIASQVRTAGSTAAEGAAGLSSGARNEVLVLPFNDVAATTRILTSRGDEIAAIIVEPVLGSSGMIAATDAYLTLLRRIASDVGALLIFDEVMTFRLAEGGYQAIVDVHPDITIFGKIIGGGLPIGGFGGSGAAMEQFAPSPRGSMTHSGTFNGHPAVMAGGIATLELLTAERVAKLNDRGDQVRNRLNRVFQDLEVSAVATGYGSLLDVHFGTTSVSSARDAALTPPELSAAIHLALMNHGIVIASRGMMNLSTAITEIDTEHLLASWREIVEALLPFIDQSYPALRPGADVAAMAQEA